MSSDKRPGVATKTFGGHYNYKLLKRFRDNTVFHGLHCGVRLIWVMLGLPTGAAIRGIIFVDVGGVADIALSTTQIFVKEIGQPPPPDKRSPLKVSGGLLSPQSEKKHHRLGDSHHQQQQTIWAWTWSTPLKMDDCVPGIGWGLTVHDPICLIGHTFLLFYFKCFFPLGSRNMSNPFMNEKNQF